MLLLSWLLLGARYKPAHVAGAVLAIVGSSILVLSDSRGGVGDGPRPLLGDGLVLIGAAIYALLNISEEHLLGVQSCSCGLGLSICLMHLMVTLQEFLTALTASQGHTAGTAGCSMGLLCY